MNMMFRVSGGRNARINPPMLNFMNKGRSYPNSGVPENVGGVCYRSSPKGWMDCTVWEEWFKEPRDITSLPHGNRRGLYVENCSSH